jgi:hypothetical protein
MSSPRGLYPVMFGDLDGDGTIEGVAPAYASAAAQRDFEILYRTQDGTRFVPYRLVTQSAPIHAALGDYDGNGLPDIAYAERMGTRERVMVSYSTRDRPLEPIEIASFTVIRSFSTINLRDTLDPTAQALDDLVVVEKPSMTGPMDPPPFTELHGNPQRSMLAYYDPREPTERDGSEFLLAVAGNFFPDTPGPDVIAIEAIGGQANVWLAPGSLGPALAPATKATTAAISVGACDGTKLCTVNADAIAWPIDDGARDVLIAVDNTIFGPRNVVTIDPLPLQVTPAAAGTLPGATNVFGMYRALLTADRTPQLVVALGDFMNDATDLLAVCDVDSRGKVVSCQSLTEMVPELAASGDTKWYCDGGGVGAVAPSGRLELPSTAPRPDDQLVVLCKQYSGVPASPVREAGVVFRIFHDGERRRAEPLFRGARDWELLSLGDVNGDQLTDLVGITFDLDVGIPALHLHLQCEARDLDCRQRSGGVLLSEPDQVVDPRP